MLRNVSVTAINVSELLRENQGGGRVKSKLGLTRIIFSKRSFIDFQNFILHSPVSFAIYNVVLLKKMKLS